MLMGAAILFRRSDCVRTTGEHLTHVVGLGVELEEQQLAIRHVYAITL